MKKLYTISLMAIMLLAFQLTFSQVDDQTVELEEVVLSLPFNQTLGKSVIKVDKINFQLSQHCKLVAFLSYFL